MTTELQPSAMPTGALIGSIVTDTAKLAGQEARLAQVELETAIKAKLTATGLLVAGAVVFVMGLAFLSLGLVHLIHRAEPVPGTTPLWAAYMIVALGLMALAALPGYAGFKRLSPAA